MTNVSKRSKNPDAFNDGEGNDYIIGGASADSLFGGDGMIFF